MFKYKNVRVGLITFTIGLTVVWSSDATKFGIWEIPVDLPEASDTVIIVQPFTKSEIPHSGGHFFTDCHSFFSSEAGRNYLRRFKQSN